MCDVVVPEEGEVTVPSLKSQVMEGMPVMAALKLTFKGGHPASGL